MPPSPPLQVAASLGSAAAGSSLMGMRCLSGWLTGASRRVFLGSVMRGMMAATGAPPAATRRRRGTAPPPPVRPPPPPRPPPLRLCAAGTPCIAAGWAAAVVGGSRRATCAAARRINCGRGGCPPLARPVATVAASAAHIFSCWKSQLNVIYGEYMSGDPSFGNIGNCWRPDPGRTRESGPGDANKGYSGVFTTRR